MSPLAHSPTETSLRPRLLTDYLLARGRSTFTTKEAAGLLGTSAETTRRALTRLARQRQIVSPAQGFWVVVPPAFRLASGVPPVGFIAEMMATLGREYYVGLLSAAELHGARGAVQETLHVMCEPLLRSREVDGRMLRFYGGSYISRTPVEEHELATGLAIRVSTREATAVDLVDRWEECGGLSKIGAALSELGELDGQALADIAGMRRRPVARRLGWMVDHFGQCSDLEPLRWGAELGQGMPVLLSKAAEKGGRVDQRWGVRLNVRP